MPGRGCQQSCRELPRAQLCPEGRQGRGEPERTVLVLLLLQGPEAWLGQTHPGPRGVYVGIQLAGTIRQGEAQPTLAWSSSAGQQAARPCPRPACSSQT